MSANHPIFQPYPHPSLSRDSKKPLILLVAAATGSRVRNKAFGIRLPLLGYPAIGLAMISALTPDPFHIRLVDDAYEPVPYGEGADLALIVGLTHQMPNAYSIADRLRSEGTLVILGGMHVTALPDEALLHADSVIVGEAEGVWKGILDDFVKGSLKRKYYGQEVNLAELPVMRRDLFNKRFYYPGQFIETTRGCSVGCVFCGAQNFFGAKFRVRPPESIRQELMAIFGPRPPQSRWKQWLARHWHPDIPYFVERRLLYVMDSNFVSDLGHARAVMQVLKEFDLRWFGHASFNLIRDEKMVDLMADSGCLGINIGFESLSQTNIDHMHKFPNKTAEYAECIKRLHEREIGVMGTFIVGFDGDTVEVFDQIVNFVRENRLETAFTLILTPKPDTTLFKQMVTENRMISHDWRDFDEGTVTFIPKNMTPGQLHHGMRSVWRRVYSWRGMWQRIMTKPRVRPFFYLPMNLGFHRCTRLICSETIWPAPKPQAQPDLRL